MRWKTKFSIAHIILVFLILSVYAISVKAHTRDALRAFKQNATDYMNTWNISGTNTLRLEYYSNRGNEDASIFPHDGDQGLNEFSINFNKRVSPYDRYTGQILGVFSGSEYRSTTEHGFILERVNITHEKGDGPIPYRWELGDHGAFFSFRTLQRTLKGGMIEVQPNWGPEGRNHSIILLTGANQPTWTGFDVYDDYYTGASWLVHDQNKGRVSYNIVHNVREKHATDQPIDRRQWVMSVAGEKIVVYKGQTLTLEGEYAYLQGDIFTRKDKNDTSIFIQVSGKNNTPLTYRFRFEHTGQDFLPAGSVTPANRRSYEAHFAYRTQDGLNYRVRLQKFDDAFESANQGKTEVAGINISGQFFGRWIENVTGRFDAFVSDTVNNDFTVDNTSNTMRLDLSKPLPRGWNGRLSLFRQDINTEVANGADTHTRQITVSGDHAIEVGKFKGSATVGVTYRKIYDHENTDNKEISPVVSGTLAHGKHRVSFNYSLDDFDREGAAELNQRRFNAAYRYSNPPHTLGLEYEKFHRDPNKAAAFVDNENSHGYKIAGFWSYDLDRPAHSGVADPSALRSQAAPNRTDVLNFAPGMLLTDAKAILNRQFGAPNNQLPSLHVYEGPVFKEFDQRQRLVVVETAGVVTKTVHIIDFEDVGNLDNVRQVFNRVKDKLIAIYGPTSDIVERGRFTAALVADLDNGDFVRNMEWRTDSGVIRFGIPHRLDGVVRMEIQHGKRFPSLNDSFDWTVEEVKS